MTPSNTPPGWISRISTGSRPSVRTLMATAAGRNARTTTPPSCGWAPSTPWGFGCSRRTSDSSSAVATLMTPETFPCSGALKQSRDPGDGNRNPVGAVVEFVAELVDGFLELVDRKEVGDRGVARGHQRRVDRREVAGQKDLSGPRFEPLGRLLTPQDLDRRGDVGERAEHARHVAQRRALLPALGQRPGGLALEVDDHPAARGGERLPQVVVAVGADHAAGDADLGPRGEALADVLAAAGDRRQALVIVGQAQEDPLDVLVDGGSEQRKRLLARLLGSEGRIAGVGGQRVMQLGGDRAEAAETFEERIRCAHDLVQGELPSVDRVGEKRLRDA